MLRKYSIAIAVFVVGTLLGAGCGREQPDLTGKWRLVQTLERGQPEELPDECVYAFDPSTKQIYVPTEEGDDAVMTYVLSDWWGTWRIEFFMEHEGRPVLVHLGILKVEGDTLTICFGDRWIDGFPFPKNFSKAETDKLTLSTFERVRDE